jgi:hypothetical protein
VFISHDPDPDDPLHLMTRPGSYTTFSRTLSLRKTCDAGPWTQPRTASRFFLSSTKQATMLWPLLTAASIVISIFSLRAQGFIPAQAINVTEGSSWDVHDNSTLSLTWDPNGSYSTVISYQLAGNGSMGVSKVCSPSCAGRSVAVAEHCMNAGRSHSRTGGEYRQ